MQCIYYTTDMTLTYIESNFTSIEFKFDMYFLVFSVSPNQCVTIYLHGPILHKILYEKTGDEQKLMKKSD